ncbi:MAG TPA: hypothetical protein VMV49_17265 [Candidatus Deferrimicrobium sp.]|nr:hypothetical protein [Candidatus Deferrimicrobium sp.]
MSGIKTNSSKQAELIGGLLIFMGVPGLLFSGIANILNLFLLPPLETSDLLIIYVRFICPFILLALGAVMLTAALKILLQDSIQGVLLVGALIAAFYGIFDGVLLFIYERIYVFIDFRMELCDFLLVLLLQYCPAVVGVFLIRRHNDRLQILN